MKEESGSHFYCRWSLRNSEITETIDSRAQKMYTNHQSTHTFYPEKRMGCCDYELLANSWGFLPALTCKRRGLKVDVTCLCK